MRNNVTNLSVHKNNKVQKCRKKSRKKMIGAVKDMANSEQVSGFYFVSWDEKGTHYNERFHDPNGAIGKSVLPSFVHGCAQRLISDIDGEGR